MESIETMIALLGLSFTVFAFFIGRGTVGKHDGKTEGMILSELGYLKSSTDEIKKHLEEQEKRSAQLITDMELVKRDVKTAFMRIDELKTTVSHLKGETEDEGN